MSYKIINNQEIIKEKEIEIPLSNPNIKIPNIQKIFEDVIENKTENQNIDDWTISTPSEKSDSIMGDVPMDIIVGMIQEYDGNEKELNIFINKINRLWNHIENNPQAEKNRFMLAVPAWHYKST